MKICAIISEYNPFHSGHKYQIDKARAVFGEDTAIIAIMSGNYTQRGEISIADKTVRARAACECGVNLVLELPFPFSMSSSEFFARSGVEIADNLGIVDYLVFGSESGNISELSDIAEIISSEAFILTVDSLNKRFKNKGYPELCELAIKTIYGGKLSSSFFTPNNILAIEYIKAIKLKKSRIIPYTIKREGAGYSEGFDQTDKYQSATGIREMIKANSASAFDFVPDSAKKIYSDAINNNKMPSDLSRLDSAIISFFRLSSPNASVDIHDAAGGLYNRLCEASTEATTISSLMSKAETKKYTQARIRRAIWNSYFGVTSSEIRALPKFTQVLAMDNVGMSLLKKIKKLTDFAVITKPAAYKDYGDEIIKQAELSHRADSIYSLAFDPALEGNLSIRMTPYVKR